MSAAILPVLLALLVAASWVAALAILRLRRALDQLHAVAFVNIAAAVLLGAAAILADGLSGRSLKILFLGGCLVLWGGVLAHAAGRALWLREGPSA
ncbi:monovalent cation/H(+) antiporter subunit G [Methylobacterium planeticum]|uniref:Cation:proton antiporter n=1 Tax=Methylobacterium planeticum TaxID=2615211 RepID=A0A6N6MQ51_9HYPH|nr:monovalent cation/H(+) antiporter subunit G [Methylobacterium planeticum]KAB1072735.1 cation:proton antiporter [Methylobacterium planeticum]